MWVLLYDITAFGCSEAVDQYPTRLQELIDVYVKSIQAHDPAYHPDVDEVR